MSNHEPPADQESALLAIAAEATEKLRHIRAAEESLARVRALAEGAYRKKSVLPKPTPALPSTEFKSPYEHSQKQIC